MTSGDTARLEQLRTDIAAVMKRSTLRPKVLALIDEAKADMTAPPPPAVSSLYVLVNQHRQSVGEMQLYMDPKAEQLAQRRAEEIARTGDFRHNPRLRDEMVEPWFAYGENIAYGYPDEAAVHQGWLDSPPHRANIENPTYTTLGVGRAKATDGRLYWVEVFVDRLS